MNFEVYFDETKTDVIWGSGKSNKGVFSWLYLIVVDFNQRVFYNNLCLESAVFSQAKGQVSAPVCFDF